MDHLKVWVGNTPVGRLSRNGRGSTFVYDAGVDPKDAISLTMPVRPTSYNLANKMLPVFDTNIPEGQLRLKINKILAKDDSGRVDPFDVLVVTGGNQIGRIRLLPEGEVPQRRRLVGSIDAYLASKSNSELIRDLIDNFALRSGVSGAMPKILAETAETAESRTTVQTRDWIMKFDDRDLPGLSMNEHHCMEAARLAGNITAKAHLSDEGTLLAVQRFDEKDGDRLGFEDFAALNARVSDEKYEGSIETQLLKSIAEFSGPDARENLERLYRQIVTSIALRNGDAHLKNYALIYEDAVDGPFKLAPMYDVVTTRAWASLKDDLMGLTLGGTKRWPKATQIKQLGARARLTPKRSAEIMSEVAAAVKEHMKEMLLDISARGRPEMALKMAEEWNEGVVFSLGAEPVEIEGIMPSPDDIDLRKAALEKKIADRTDVTNPFENPGSEPKAPDLTEP